MSLFLTPGGVEGFREGLPLGATLQQFQPGTCSGFFILNLSSAQTNFLAQVLDFPLWKILWNKYVYSSICFLSSTAGSQMKCDVDFSLLCIKYTKQTFAFPMLEIALSENCFQQRLRVCISLVTGLLWLSNGSKLSSFILPSVPESNTVPLSQVARVGCATAAPSAQGFLRWINSHLLVKTVVSHKQCQVHQRSASIQPVKQRNWLYTLF